MLKQHPQVVANLIGLERLRDLHRGHAQSRKDFLRVDVAEGLGDLGLGEVISDREGEFLWSDLIAVEYGATQGTYLLSKGPSIIVIDADGRWTLRR